MTKKELEMNKLREELKFQIKKNTIYDTIKKLKNELINTE
jgi:hypothetical protein